MSCAKSSGFQRQPNMDARVVELVDSLASGASARKGVRVRLPPRAPRRSKRHIVCSDFFYKKSERTHFIAPPFQITTAALGCDLGSPLCGVFRFCRNIGFNRYLHKNNQTFRCGYFYEYREDFTYPAEVNSACAKVFECPPHFEQFT